MECLLEAESKHEFQQEMGEKGGGKGGEGGLAVREQLQSLVLQVGGWEQQ